ncbi:hypothetical protein [Actinoplanes sp. NPDC049316]|uniref:hypothetical protein n=1 Tax=Actinoplanes sp. NPDC049316 TaxID=3154727 RepID=UPI00341F438A
MELIIVIAVVLTVLSAGLTFLVVRRDLRPGPAVAVSAGAGLAVGLCWFFILYLALGALAAALLAYVAVRRLGTVRAAAVSGVAAYAMVALASAALIAAALESM